MNNPLSGQLGQMKPTMTGPQILQPPEIQTDVGRQQRAKPEPATALFSVQ